MGVGAAGEWEKLALDISDRREEVEAALGDDDDDQNGVVPVGGLQYG